jgi:hypothetical protein
LLGNDALVSSPRFPSVEVCSQLAGWYCPPAGEEQQR